MDEVRCPKCNSDWVYADQKSVRRHEVSMVDGTLIIDLESRDYEEEQDPVLVCTACDHTWPLPADWDWEEI